MMVNVSLKLVLAFVYSWKVGVNKKNHKAKLISLELTPIPNLDLIPDLIVLLTFPRNVILINHSGIFWSAPMMYSVTEAHSVPTSLPHPLIGGNCMLKSLSSSSSPEEDVLAQKKKTNYFFSSVNTSLTLSFFWEARIAGQRWYLEEERKGGGGGKQASLLDKYLHLYFFYCLILK